jgi:hypothetical protein
MPHSPLELQKIIHYVSNPSVRICERENRTAALLGSRGRGGLGISMNLWHEVGCVGETLTLPCMIHFGSKCSLQIPLLQLRVLMDIIIEWWGHGSKACGWRGWRCLKFPTLCLVSYSPLAYVNTCKAFDGASKVYYQCHSWEQIGYTTCGAWRKVFLGWESNSLREIWRGYSVGLLYTFCNILSLQTQQLQSSLAFVPCPLLQGERGLPCMTSIVSCFRVLLFCSTNLLQSQWILYTQSSENIMKTVH